MSVAACQCCPLGGLWCGVLLGVKKETRARVSIVSECRLDGWKSEEHQAAVNECSRVLALLLSREFTPPPLALGKGIAGQTTGTKTRAKDTQKAQALPILHVAEQ